MQQYHHLLQPRGLSLSSFPSALRFLWMTAEAVPCKTKSRWQSELAEICNSGDEETLRDLCERFRLKKNTSRSNSPARVKNDGANANPRHSARIVVVSHTTPTSLPLVLTNPPLVRRFCPSHSKRARPAAAAGATRTWTRRRSGATTTTTSRTAWASSAAPRQPQRHAVAARCSATPSPPGRGFWSISARAAHPPVRPSIRPSV